MRTQLWHSESKNNYHNLTDHSPNVIILAIIVHCRNSWEAKMIYIVYAI